MGKAPKKIDDDEFAGVTRSDCCSACKEGVCVISMNEFCHHPFKASHPLATPEIVARVNEVRKIIKRQAIDRE